MSLIDVHVIDNVCLISVTCPAKRIDSLCRGEGGQTVLHKYFSFSHHFQGSIDFNTVNTDRFCSDVFPDASLGWENGRKLSQVGISLNPRDVSRASGNILVVRDIHYTVPLYIPPLQAVYGYILSFWLLLVTLQSLYTADQEKVLHLSSNAAGKESALWVNQGICE